MGMLLVSRLVADPGIEFDNRLLSPIFLLTSVVIATALASWWPSAQRDAVGDLARIAVAAVLIAWCAASASDTTARAHYVMDTGSDLAGDEWRESELIRWARRQGEGHPLYTNWPSAVYFHLHRPAHALPLAGDSASLATFAEDLKVAGHL